MSFIRHTEFVQRPKCAKRLWNRQTDRQEAKSCIWEEFWQGPNKHLNIQSYALPRMTNCARARPHGQLVHFFKLFVPCIFSTYGIKTNWCHYFIRILLDLYMFRPHRPIFRRVRTAVDTTIGSVSVRSGRVHTEHANRAVQILNQWLCEQLYELSWRWVCGPETCRDPAIYE